MDHPMNNSKYNLPSQKPKKISPAPERLPYGWNRHELYDGKELRAFEGRPGAMDAYKLPSRGIG